MLKLCSRWTAEEIPGLQRFRTVEVKEKSHFPRGFGLETKYDALSFILSFDRFCLPVLLPARPTFALYTCRYFIPHFFSRDGRRRRTKLKYCCKKSFIVCLVVRCRALLFPILGDSLSVHVCLPGFLFPVYLGSPVNVVMRFRFCLFFFFTRYFQ